MNYKDYDRIKIGGYFSLGKFGENLYCLENLTGFASVPEYHRITKEEFDSFDEWKNSKEKIFEIICRPVFCSIYTGYRDFNENNL